MSNPEDANQARQDQQQVSFIPNLVEQLTLDSNESKQIAYPFQDFKCQVKLRFKPTDAANTRKISGDIATLLQPEFVGRGSVWLKAIHVQVVSHKAEGRLGIRLTHSNEAEMTWDNFTTGFNVHYFSFNAATKGNFFPFDLSWPTSIAHQLVPASSRYYSPVLCLRVGKDTKCDVSLTFVYDCTKMQTVYKGFPKQK